MRAVAVARKGRARSSAPKESAYRPVDTRSRTLDSPLNVLEFGAPVGH